MDMIPKDAHLSPGAREKKTRRMLTGHDVHDSDQRAGEIQCEPIAIGDERIEDDPERLPAANHAERDQSNKAVH